MGAGFAGALAALRPGDGWTMAGRSAGGEAAGADARIFVSGNGGAGIGSGEEAETDGDPGSFAAVVLRGGAP